MKAGRKIIFFSCKRNRSSSPPREARSEGFGLVECLIAMIVLTFGLLAAGQMIYAAMSSQALARSKGSAGVVAQNKLEFLADLYRQNSGHADLTVGNHGPESVQVTNPISGSIMNQYNVNWSVAVVPDPRAGVTLDARQITVTATPVLTGTTTANTKSGLNKVVNVTGIFSVRPQ